MISWERLTICFCLKRWYCHANWQQKSEERNGHLFRHTTCGLFTQRFFVQQFLKLMSKIGKYDGSSCIAKMLDFSSKTFKKLAFTFGIDLLLSHSHHLWFSKMHCRNLTRKKNAGWDFYATPKFWHKIQDLQKSVEYLLNRPRLPLTKSFLQLRDVLKLVYNTHSWP